uniref:protein-serine/threonine phosphatase n=1 Tax=Fagus sylvatica TaxID=28930 RepID=A0A2N9EJ65_FAGSY
MGRNYIYLFWGRKPEDMEDAEWTLLDRQVLGVIRLTLSRTVAHNVVKEKTTAELMTALCGMYEKPSANNKVHLMKKLFNLKMAEGTAVAQHLNEFNTITNQLSSVEIEFDDEIRALIVLASLPNSWEAMRMAVSNSAGKGKLKYNDIRDLILGEEVRRRDAGETSSSGSALNLEARGRGKDRNYNRGRSKSRKVPLNPGSWTQEPRFIPLHTEKSSKNYVAGDFGKVYLADDEALDVVGMGDVRITLPNGSVWLLQKVRHVPELKRNLISVGQLDTEGHAILFVGGTWKITKGAMVVARGKKTGTLYMTTSPRDTIAVAEAGADTNLWHRRLGHMSEKGMKVLLSKDNGGEYINGGFKEFCAANGIRMEKTIPRTPQQNGVAERMNRTLNERARSMRLHAGLPETFWADAVNTAAYLINRGPSVPLEFRIPEEVWSGKEVNLSYLKVFGCVSYVHIDSDARSKLDAKSRKCFFIGYGDETFGYRFWDDQNRKVIRSRNVIFNEQVMYKDRSSTKLDDVKVEQKKSEFVNLDEFSNNTMQNSGQEEKENADPQVEQCTPTITVRRSSRNIRPPQRFSPSLFYILLTDGGEPESYDEALQIEDSIKWELAMKDEMNSLMTSQTWELTELPQRKKALHNKWVYRVKEEHDGSKMEASLTTIRLVLGIVATENLHLEQLDVKTAFLHGDLEEDIYMSQPQGFIVQGKENLVCKLRKSLYGLKQAPRQWYKKFDSFMYSTGFTRCQADHCCYVKSFDNSYIILLLYVDDMLIAGSSIEEINNLKKQLSKQFAMKDLGPAKQILGMRIIRDRANGTLKLSQTEYVKKILSRFSMDEAKSVSTPLGSHFRLTKDQSPKTEQEQAYMSKVPYASAIGSLMYAMVCTRPDIAHAVGVVSRYMSNPGKQHWEAVKWILRYLKGTLGTSLCFTGADMKLTGYVDSDLAGDVDTRKSTTEAEAEYVAVTEAGKEMVWLQGFLGRVGSKAEESTSTLLKTRSMKFQYAMVCSSNQNRSMEAHSLLKRQGFNVSSYGTGAHVKLPGPSLREPNVYDFGTPYKQMFDDLRRKDPELYKRNGILPMLKRNSAVKLAPQRWQENAADGSFDVVFTFEEKVFDMVVEGWYIILYGSCSLPFIF